MRRTTPALLAALGAVAFPATAHATDYRVDYQFPTADHAGFAPAVGAGFSACGAGATGSGCRTPGELTARVNASTAIAAWAAADFIFTPPAGTTIVGGSMTVNHREGDPAIHARLLYRTSGTWQSMVFPDRPTMGPTAVTIPAGVLQFGPSLYARTAVPAGQIRSSTANELDLRIMTVIVRDLGLPAVTVAAGALTDGGWHRGVVCNRVDASDGGLGVYGAFLDIDGQRASLLAPVVSKLQPRPRAFGGALCFDTRGLHDGYLTGAVSATDGATAAGNGSPARAVVLHVDNTAPTASIAAPAESEERAPVITVRAADGTSGLATVTTTIDDAPVVLPGQADGSWLGRPATLTYGNHIVRVTASDAAGNTTTASLTIAIVDRTPPTISALAPAPGATVDGSSAVAFVVADGGSGIVRSSLAVSLDGRDVDASGVLAADGRFGYTPRPTLEPGAHRVVVQVADDAGNRVEQSWTFTVPTPTSPPPPPPAALELTFDKATVTVRARSRFVIGVRAHRGSAGERGVRVVARWKGGTEIGSAVSDENGVADLPIVASREGTVVATVGDADAEIRVVFARGVVLHASRTHVRRGRPVTLSGTVEPASAGVVLEAYSQGSWHAIRSLRAAGDGAFKSRLVFRRRGLYIVRATVGDRTSKPVQIWVR